MTTTPRRPQRTPETTIPTCLVPETLTSRGFGVRALGPLSAVPLDGAEPALRALWDRMTTGLSWLTPQLDHRAYVTHGPPHRMRSRSSAELTRLGTARGVETETSRQWSGSIDVAPAGSTYRYVGGGWTVPDRRAEGADGCHDTAEWVGLDGWSFADVLQAGTGTHVIGTPFFCFTHTYAWWEWWPVGEVAIRNLPVSPGDAMWCLICADTPTGATVTVTNQSRGLGACVEITPPSDRSLVASVAEWIVERPTVGGPAGATGCLFEDSAAG